MSRDHVSPALPPSQWWLSFVDPVPDKFLGVAIVTATDLVSAVSLTHLKGINPGGQVKVVGPIPEGSIAPEWCDRLLTREEAESVPAPEWAS